MFNGLMHGGLADTKQASADQELPEGRAVAVTDDAVGADACCMNGELEAAMGCFRAGCFGCFMLNFTLLAGGESEAALERLLYWSAS